MPYKKLIEKAYKAKEMAYVPYSKFQVGAAVLTDSGKIFTGCNIENASYGATNCAERTAIFKAISEGERNFKAIAIVSSSGDFTYPCGICRQVIVEFMKDGEIILANEKGEYKVYTVQEILPFAFTEKDIK
ncbi:cytidine deaminase [Defluviitalea phaphyphila]|uniref:cytidine deaminase n=1 Tax=Defluviitalea phaphyphila TaxID=1473580 RepID=UPI000730F3AF|nr:cytidine deaminase [Defluviitalea phaphyphila]